MKNFLIFLDFTKKLYYRDRSMVYSMAMRDLKARYVGSFFGFFWAVLTPLFELAIYGLIFGLFLGQKPDPSYGTDSYFIFLLCGLIPWLFFSQTFTSATGILIKNGGLIKQAVGFPSEVLPIITVMSNLISHLIGMGVLVVVLVILEGSFKIQTLLVVVYLFPLIIFLTGFGWIVSSLNIYLRDIEQVIKLLNRAWFFLTPIVYTPSVIPEKILPIMKINPMFHVVEAYRQLILNGRFPPGKDLIFLIIISLVTFCIGGLLFSRLKPGFAEAL